MTVIAIRDYTITTTDTVPAGATHAIFRGWGGGGAGGGYLSNYTGPGAGGGGSEEVDVIVPVTAGASATVTIGAGGTAVATPSTAANVSADGGNGGDTTYVVGGSTLVTCPGAQGGSSCYSGTAFTGAGISIAMGGLPSRFMASARTRLSSLSTLAAGYTNPLQHYLHLEKRFGCGGSVALGLGGGSLNALGWDAQYSKNGNAPGTTSNYNSTDIAFENGGSGGGGPGGVGGNGGIYNTTAATAPTANSGAGGGGGVGPAASPALSPGTGGALGFARIIYVSI